jgi:toxin ParE1/3/4
MPSYELTSHAEEDLADIIEYTGSQGFYRELKNIHPRLRVTRCQHHYIFGIMRSGSPMVVVAIYHERMDVLQRLRTRLKNPQEG